MKKLSGLLTLATCLGVGLTGFLGYKAGKKVQEEGLDLKDLNNLKKVAPKVVPAVAVGALTMTSSIAAHKIDAKQVAIASSIGLASLAGAKHLESEVKDFIGPQKYEELKRKMFRKIETNAPFAQISQNEKPEVPGEPVLNWLLNIDSHPVKFTAPLSKVLMAEIAMNRRVQDPEYEMATVADFKDELGLQPSDDDPWTGWDIESLCSLSPGGYCWIDFDHNDYTTVDGVKVIEITTKDTPPVYLYDSWRITNRSTNELLEAWQNGAISQEEYSNELTARKTRKH